MNVSKIIEKSIIYLKQLDKEFEENRLSVPEKEYNSITSYIIIICKGHPYLEKRKIK